MKDFEEFKQFVLQDNMHELRAMGARLNQRYTDEELERIGMTPEALGMLLKVVSSVISDSTLVMLKAYHEWDHDFPNRNNP